MAFYLSPFLLYLMMKRRQFLLLTGTGIISLGVPFAGCNIHHPTYAPWLTPPTHLSTICDTATLKSIGFTYLGQHRNEENEERLAELIMDDDNGKPHQPEKDDAATRAWLDQKISKEFQSGKTTVVKGWVLAQTEARQCALFALTVK